MASSVRTRFGVESTGSGSSSSSSLRHILKNGRIEHNSNNSNENKKSSLILSSTRGAHFQPSSSASQHGSDKVELRFPHETRPPTEQHVIPNRNVERSVSNAERDYHWALSCALVFLSFCIAVGHVLLICSRMHSASRQALFLHSESAPLRREPNALEVEWSSVIPPLSIYLSYALSLCVSACLSVSFLLSFFGLEYRVCVCVSLCACVFVCVCANLCVRNSPQSQSSGQ